MNSNESNSSKSKKGNDLNQKVKVKLEEMLGSGDILGFKYEPRYNHPTTERKQFSPDGEVTTLEENIVIYDNTTTVRHDRLKQKLWDAYGIKEHFRSKGKQIQYFVIIPDDADMLKKEIDNANRERQKINAEDYYSTIDDILTFTEFISFIQAKK